MIRLLLKPYIFLFFCVHISFGFSDTTNELLQSLRNANAKEVAAFFAPNISITIKNETGFYSKFQAEMVLSDFFRSNKPIEVKQVQRIANTSNTSNYYIIYQFKTSSNAYRVFVRFTDSSGTHQISEFRIE